MGKFIKIFDTTLRDGEQSPGASMNTDEKIKIALQLQKLGVDIIEAGFAKASPGDFEAIERIASAIDKSTVCSLARAVDADIKDAGEAIKAAKNRRIHTFIATSKVHMEYKLKMAPDEVVKRAVHAVQYAKTFVDDVEFSCEDATRSDIVFLKEIVAAVVEAGAKTINLPDTVGYTTPNEYFRLVSEINKITTDKAVISVHCHNDLGMATANTIAGVLNGARQVEVTINGIGERAGNTALEEIAMIIKSHHEIDIQTNINTQKIYPTSRMVSSLMNMPVQPNKAIVGRNAFAHSSGIHQDGVLKNRENYEIMNPEDVGVSESSIVLTARSGRAALKHRFSVLGYEFEGQPLDDMYDAFLRLADKKKDITDDDLETLAGKKRSEDRNIKLVSLQVTCGKTSIPTATVQISFDGDIFTETATGDGPVDAAYTACKKMIKRKVHLEEYLVQAVTRGSNDMGKVHVQIEHNGRSFYGFGASTDIVTASVEAFLDAVSKIN
mgnify:CR=1 FL=1